MGKKYNHHFLPSSERVCQVNASWLTQSWSSSNTPNHMWGDSDATLEDLFKEEVIPLDDIASCHRVKPSVKQLYTQMWLTIGWEISLIELTLCIFLGIIKESKELVKILCVCTLIFHLFTLCFDVVDFIIGTLFPDGDLWGARALQRGEKKTRNHNFLIVLSPQNRTQLSLHDVHIEEYLKGTIN